MKTHTNRYLSKLLKGEKLRDIFILDSHSHYGVWSPMHVIRHNAEDIIKTMDRLCIDSVILNAVTHSDYKYANERIFEMIKKYPGRVYGLAVVDIYDKEVTQQLEHCFDEFDFVGIKLHEMMMYSPYNPRFDINVLKPIFEFASHKKCPILCHGLITEKILNDYPQVKFIWAHGPKDINVVLRLAKFDNFYIDTAYTIFSRGTLKLFVEKIGVERILFASDMPFSSPTVRIGQVLSSDISDEQACKILGLNAANLYNIQSR